MSNLARRYSYFGLGYIAVIFLVVTLTSPGSALSIPITLIGPALVLYLSKRAYENAVIGRRSLVTALILGGGICTFTAGIANSFASIFLKEYYVTVAFAPVVEEALKIGALYLLREAIKTPLQGALYGMYVGAGFTIVEDILYLANASSAAEALGTSVTRLLFNPFLHMLCTALAGWVYGSRKSQLGRVYIAAVYLHGFWNLLASTGLSISWIYGVSYTLALGYIIDSANREQAGRIKEFEESENYDRLLAIEKEILKNRVYEEKVVDLFNWRQSLLNYAYRPSPETYKELCMIREKEVALTKYRMLSEKNFAPYIPGYYLDERGWRYYG
jgi:RsiW-degrading membrane proteinase PrsW (M82 family)